MPHIVLEYSAGVLEESAIPQLMTDMRAALTKNAAAGITTERITGRAYAAPFFQLRDAAAYRA